MYTTEQQSIIQLLEAQDKQNALIALEILLANENYLCDDLIHFLKKIYRTKYTEIQVGIENIFLQYNLKPTLEVFSSEFYFLQLLHQKSILPPDLTSNDYDEMRVSIEAFVPNDIVKDIIRYEHSFHFKSRCSNLLSRYYHTDTYLLDELRRAETLLDKIGHKFFLLQFYLEEEQYPTGVKYLRSFYTSIQELTQNPSIWNKQDILMETAGKEFYISEVQLLLELGLERIKQLFLKQVPYGTTHFNQTSRLFNKIESLLKKITSILCSNNNTYSLSTQQLKLPFGK